MKSRLSKTLTALILAVCLLVTASFAASAALYEPGMTITSDNFGQMTVLESAPESHLTLEEKKIKNMSDWGYFNVDGEDVWYFYGDGTAAANPEIRFVTDGTDTSVKNNGSYTFAPETVNGFSFTYKLVNTDAKEVADLKDSGINYIVQSLSSDGTYPIFVPEIVADGLWHTVTVKLDTALRNTNLGANFDAVNELFSGFIFKMGGFNGELMIKDVRVAEPEPPESFLTLETAKIKNMTDWGYYNIGGESVWYFYGDGTAAANPEIRFVTDGTDTSVKNNGSYTFAPVEIDGFSFSYKLTNSDEKNVVDASHNYIVQSLSSDGSYPIFIPEIVADGEWHTVSVSLDTVLSNTNLGATFDDVNHLFSGFIFKMGGFNGELMIKDIAVEKATAPESFLTLETAKIKNMTDWGYYNIGGEDVWYFYGDGTAAANPEIRFVTDGTDTSVKVNGSYTFAPVEIDGFSFSYKLTNSGAKEVADLTNSGINYIVQSLSSDGSYPIFVPEIVADGEWHTVSVSLDTVLSNTNLGATFDDVNHLFSGFIFKMGGFNGELMIKDIAIVEAQPALTYTVTFVADGETVGTATYSEDNKAITEPEVPAKEHYDGAWEAYTLTTGDVTVNAVYTPHAYKATFVHPDSGMQIAAPVSFTIESIGSVVFPTVHEDFRKEGFNMDWSIKPEELTLEDTTVYLTATPIEYTVTFVADGETVATEIYTVENKTITEPEVPEKTGYTGAWEAYTLTTGDVTVNAAYTAVEYTVTFVANGETVDTLTYTVENKAITEPTVPAKADYDGAWEAYELTTGNVTVNAVYTATEYTVTFVADGETVDTLTYTVENKAITEPTAPEKTGYTVAWESYELTTGNITVNAAYTAVEYTVTFVANGETVDTLTYTVENKAITAPTVPAKADYDGAWEAYELTTGNVTVNAVYTATEYTVTFVADGVTVATATYTVENKTITAPAVPEKEGFTAAWETYELTSGDLTVNAVYTEVNNSSVGLIIGISVAAVACVGVCVFLFLRKRKIGG